MSAPQTHNPDRVQTPSDEALVAHAQLDPTGFDAIFDRYWYPVLRSCFYRLETGIRRKAQPRRSS
jgi:hypothetical protein